MLVFVCQRSTRETKQQHQKEQQHQRTREEGFEWAVVGRNWIFYLSLRRGIR